MDKIAYLEDLPLGKNFASLVVSRSDVSYKDTASGKMVSMSVHDTSTRRAVKFSLSDADQEVIQNNKVLVLDGMVQNEEAYSGQIKVFHVAPFLGAVQPEWFARSLPENHEQTKALFHKVMDSVQEQHLLLLLEAVFCQETRSAFFNAVAAKKQHHAYPGGLLEHSVEVALLCDGVSRRIKSLDRDLLVAVALFHDIGKLDEMNHDISCGEFTFEGTMQGHVTLGERRVAQCAANIEGFPSRLSGAVSHMILSHHGKREFGAAVLPAFPEAFILAQCDLMSARMYTCCEKKRTAAVGVESVYFDNNDDFSPYLFIGDLGLQKSDPPLSSVPKFSSKPHVKEPATSYTTRLQVRGLVAAGDPEKSSDEPQEERDVMPPPSGADFLLRVTGDSMVGAGIQNGDLLFVRDQPSAENGEIVIAHLGLEGEVVKRLVKEPDPNAPHGGRVWLKSENPDPKYAPILVDEETRIQGKVTGMLRDY